MNETLSIDEIFTHYSDQWVLLDELESHDNLTVQRGRVVGHGSELPAVEAMAVEMRLPRCVIVCTKQKDGRDAVPRDYAVSTIASWDEIAAELAKVA